MPTIAVILIALVAAEHLYFLYLEMFAWTASSTRRSFGTTAEFAEASKSLAANQGLYNGFLAAGLIWSIVHPDPLVGKQIALFFLACVLVAAAYGGWSVKRSIMLIQGLPALLALLALLFL
jgi:putative membrane protein